MQVGCKSGARSVQSGAVVKKYYLTANSKIVAGGRVMKVKCGRATFIGRSFIIYPSKTSGERDARKRQEQPAR